MQGDLGEKGYLFPVFPRTDEGLVDAKIVRVNRTTFRVLSKLAGAVEQIGKR